MRYKFNFKTMNNYSNFNHESSYKMHEVEELQMAAITPSIISQPESIDRLRHQRMLDALTTKLIPIFPEASWLTIGDGRCGSDSIYLKYAGAKHIHTSSITDLSFKTAQQNGWIETYSAENAENLSFNDNSFDFVLCKESYHHFPRPAIGFYEMLRVSRIGVVLIEPNLAGFSPLKFMKTIFKKITSRSVFSEYEPSGNYIFRLDPKQLYHMARAMNLPAMATAFHNDFYHPRLFKSAVRTRLETIIFKIGIGIQNSLCFLRLLAPGGVSCVVFKKSLTDIEINQMKRSGINVTALIRNPYIYC